MYNTDDNYHFLFVDSKRHAMCTRNVWGWVIKQMGSKNKGGVQEIQRTGEQLHRETKPHEIHNMTENNHKTCGLKWNGPFTICISCLEKQIK